MASNVAGSSVEELHRVPVPIWHFSWEDVAEKSASRKDCIKYEQELQLRQRAARFIQRLAERLNYGIKESRNKISQLCICAATVHMHRFFYFHSFKKFHYKDICAACLFMCGKSEECPRKLEHVVRHWWALKFDNFPQIPDKYYHDAAHLIVTLESVILQTIAFDLKVDLPHTIVLQQMQQINRDLGHKRLTEVAYFFATDVLCVTDWPIRYTAAEIAAICIYAVCAWADHKISSDTQKPWYNKFAPDLNEKKLQTATNEFLNIYRSYTLAKEGQGFVKLAKFVQKGMIVPRPLEAKHLTQESDALLPPPPLPPAITFRKEASDAKVKRSGHSISNETSIENTTTSSSNMSQVSRNESQHEGSAPMSTGVSGPRTNFMPDLNNLGKLVHGDLRPFSQNGSEGNHNDIFKMPKEECASSSLLTDKTTMELRVSSDLKEHRKHKEHKKHKKEHRERDREDEKNEKPHRRHRREEDQREHRKRPYEQSHSTNNDISATNSGSQQPIEKRRPISPTHDYRSTSYKRTYIMHRYECGRHCLHNRRRDTLRHSLCESPRSTRRISRNISGQANVKSMHAIQYTVNKKACKMLFEKQSYQLTSGPQFVSTDLEDGEVL